MAVLVAQLLLVPDQRSVRHGSEIIFDPACASIGDVLERFDALEFSRTSDGGKDFNAETPRRKGAKGINQPPGRRERRGGLRRSPRDENGGRPQGPLCAL